MKPTRVSYLIRRAQLLVYNNLTDCLHEHNLTPMQYMLLSLLRRSSKMSSADLARRLAVAPQSISEMIAGLQLKRLIARKSATKHRRILRVSLTRKGTRLLQKCDQHVDSMEKRLFEPLSPSDLDGLQSALTKLIESRRVNEPTGEWSRLQR